jgi:protease-4
MERRHPILRRLVMLIGVVVGLFILGALVSALRGGGMAQRFGKSVGVAEVRGVIGDATDVIETLEGFRKQANTVAIVLRIDSPGGAVAPAQEIYEEVRRVREAKPVVASLGNVAASGGYYVAAAADTIVADPGTLTGSIGAIMTLQNYTDLAQKLGVSEAVVKSGRYKDIGHPLRPLTDEERKLLQGMIDDVLGQFVDAVAQGRRMEAARVRVLADGRLYSGAQAKAAGLVDELGGLEVAIQLAWERAGQTGEPRAARVRAHRPWWQAFLSETLGPVPQGLGGGLLFLYGGSLPNT